MPPLPHESVPDSSCVSLVFASSEKPFSLLIDVGVKENHTLRLHCEGSVLADCFGGILPPSLPPMSDDVLVPRYTRPPGILSI